MIKLMTIITLCGAFALGMSEGDCTAAVIMTMLFVPAMLKKRRDK